VRATDRGGQAACSVEQSELFLPWWVPLAWAGGAGAGRSRRSAVAQQEGTHYVNRREGVSQGSMAARPGPRPTHDVMENLPSFKGAVPGSVATSLRCCCCFRHPEHAPPDVCRALWSQVGAGRDGQYAGCWRLPGSGISVGRKCGCGQPVPAAAVATVPRVYRWRQAAHPLPSVAHSPCSCAVVFPPYSFLCQGGTAPGILQIF